MSQPQAVMRPAARPAMRSSTKIGPIGLALVAALVVVIILLVVYYFVFVKNNLDTAMSKVAKAQAQAEAAIAERNALQDEINALAQSTGDDAAQARIRQLEEQLAAAQKRADEAVAKLQTATDCAVKIAAEKALWEQERAALIKEQQDTLASKKQQYEAMIAELRNQINLLSSNTSDSETISVLKDRIKVLEDEKISDAAEAQAQLNQMRTSHEVEIKALKEDIVKLQSQVSDLRAQVANLTTQRDDAIAKVTRIESELVAVRNKYAQAETDINTTRTQITRLQAREAELSAMVDDLKIKLDDCIKYKTALESNSSTATAELKSLLDAKTREANDLRAKVTSLESELLNLRQTGQTAVNNLSDLQQKYALLEKSMNELRAQSAAASSDYEATIDSLNIRIGDLTKKVDVMVAQEQDLRTQIANLQKQLAEATEKADLRVKDTITIYDAKIATLNATITSLQADLKAYEDKNSTKDAIISQLRTSVASMTTQRDDALTKVDKLDALIVTLQNDNVQLKSDIATRDAKIAQLTSERDSLVTKLTSVDAQVRSLNLQLSSANSTITELKNMIAAKDTAINQLTSERNALTTKLTNVENELRAALTKVSSLTTQINNLNGTIASLKNDIVVRDKQISELNVKLSASNTTIASLRSQISARDVTISDLKTKADAYLKRALAAEAQLKPLQTQLNDSYAKVTMLENEILLLDAGSKISSSNCSAYKGIVEVQSNRCRYRGAYFGKASATNAMCTNSKNYGLDVVCITFSDGFKYLAHAPSKSTSQKLANGQTVERYYSKSGYYIHHVVGTNLIALF